ncbi:hypothetical protein DSECCO2_611380 [anaerobic digester metagenome]
MRNPQAFQIALCFKLDCRPEVGFKQFAVLLSQDLKGQRSACFRYLMGDLLIFGKHRLPEEGGDDVVDLLAYNICLGLVVG